MVEKRRKLADVFGVSRKIPLTYTERVYVDQRFLNDVARDKHIVVYGGSKQGKTCLRKHCLDSKDYIVVQCANDSSKEQLYASILKEAGATTTVTESRTVRGGRKLGVKFSVSGGVPFVGKGGSEGGVESSEDSSVTTERSYLEIDASDCNDIIRTLQTMEFKKFIVFEDFHYLSEDIQKDVAIDLKAFHEKSDLVFIIVGVWLESNRLVLYNGDLAGRLVPIDADRWETSDLRLVLSAGEGLLNISFPEDVKDEIINSTQANVGILQECCHRLCEEQKIFFTLTELSDVGTPQAVRRIVGEIGREQAGRYQNFLSQFVEGFQRTQLDMYRWIARVLIELDPRGLKAGVRTKDIFRRLQEIHPHKELQFNNVLHSLKQVHKLQHRNRVQPVVLDFDSNENVLRIVDSGFTLYLASSERSDLESLVGAQLELPR